MARDRLFSIGDQPPIEHFVGALRDDIKRVSAQDAPAAITAEQDLRDYIAAHGGRYLDPGAVSLQLVALRGEGEAALVRAMAVRAQLIADPSRELHEHPGLPNRLLGATEDTLAQRLGQPADMVGAAVFLLSDESAWVTGQILAVDGGQTFRS